MSPFELYLGWNPKSALDFISGAEDSVIGVENLKEKLKSLLEDAQFSYKVSNSLQAAESSVRFKTPDCRLGSKLWVNSK